MNFICDLLILDAIGVIFPSQKFRAINARVKKISRFISDRQ